MATPQRVVVGTAGWSIPRAVADAFPVQGTGLQRYAARFRGVEINSTFYRPHRASTFARWRESTPAEFRFCVKIPKALTHTARLVGCGDGLRQFVSEASELGEKLELLLVQLPPSLAFEPGAATGFFQSLRELWTGGIVCEPRHASWFTDDIDELLGGLSVSRAAVDPAICEAARTPGGYAGLAYWRLHGSPRMYYSAHDDAVLKTLAGDIATVPAPDVWCMFDNTTSGAAAANALALVQRLGPPVA